jgi:predicted membrane protein
MKKQIILRNIFISVGVLFALTRMLAAGTGDDLLNFGDTPLCHRHPIIITFDAPGAGTLTSGHGINPSGVIAGVFFDANNVAHGFVRYANGTITTFDAPGAGTDPGEGTFMFIPVPINPMGTITGYYLDASFVAHGFVRHADGTITTFDVPGAGTGPGQGTVGSGISPAGVIAGSYVDSNNVIHGIVRYANGTVITLDVPCAGTGPGQGTQALSINPMGMITGLYADANNVVHGFARAVNGTITTFDPPGSVFTAAGSINPMGTITGIYLDASGVSHGFLRTP